MTTATLTHGLTSEAGQQPAKWEKQAKRNRVAHAKMSTRAERRAATSALVVAVSATTDWKTDQVEHKRAQSRWSTVLDDIGAIRLEGDSPKYRHQLEIDHAKPADDEPNVPPRMWDATDKWLAKHQG